jgi:multicomponent K+:H+ antiporter subunit E
MKRLFPFPALSGLLFVAWFVIAADYSASHLVLAALLAVAIPILVRPVTQRGAHVHRWSVALKLVFIVLWDIVVANVTVARMVLGRVSRLKPGFVPVPVDTDNVHVMTLFASIITMTPGTVSCEVDAERRVILVHALDVDDIEQAARDMKARYEAPLKEIFRC